MSEWIDEVTEILKSKSETEIINLCRNFEECEKEINEYVREIEGSVDAEFSTDCPVFLLKERDVAERLNKLNSRQYLYYLAMSINIYIARNEEVTYTEKFSEFEDQLSESTQKLKKFIAEEGLMPSGSAAYQRPDDGFINIQILPKSSLPESKLFEPLREVIGRSNAEIKGTLAHELTHAYIKKETGVTTASVNTDTYQGLITEVADDLNIGSHKTGKDESTSRDSQLLAINESAGHISGRIYDKQNFNVRGYELESGINRKDAHQSLYLLAQLSDSYSNKGEKLSKIREVSVVAIKKKHEKNNMNEGFWKIQKFLSQKVNNIPDPESAIGYLEILVLERTEDIEMEKYRKLGFTAEKFMESEAKILNFFSIINDSKLEHESYDLGGVWEALIPVEGDVPINIDRRGVQKEGEELKLISPEEFRDALRDLDEVPDADKFKKTLKKLSKIQEGEKNLIENIKGEIPEEKKEIISDTESITKEIFDAKTTDHQTIEETESNMYSFLDEHISRRKELISEARGLCNEIIELESELEQIEKHARNKKNSEKLSKLIELTDRNIVLAKKSREKLHEAENLLNEAEREINS